MQLKRLSTTLSILLLTACHSPFAASDWTSRVALHDPENKLGGCAAGDLIPSIPGAEIATVAEDGSVYVIHLTEQGDWKHVRAWKAPGEMIQCAIGDADPTHPGVELVGVGMEEGNEDSGGTGAVYLVHAGEGGTPDSPWHAEKIYTEGSLVHGVAIVDGSIWIAGFDEKLRRLHRTVDGWVSDPSAECALPGAGKNVLALDENRIAVACTDGSLVLATRVRDRFALRVLHQRQRATGRARLASDGARIVVADDDGSLYVIRPNESGPRQAELIYKDDQKLRGAVLADLEPLREGLEVATAGYSSKLSILAEPRTGRADQKAWAFDVLMSDQGRLHHLIAAEVDGKPGLDLVTCGYEGKIFVLSRAGAR